MIITRVLGRRNKMRIIIIFLYSLLFLGCRQPFQAEEKQVKRVALVIGNQHYVDNELENPISDAQGIAKTLESIGFDVLLKLDITLAQLNRALERLKKRIEANNTIVFIYFAGHGNTLKKGSSEEYLMMTDKRKKVLVSIYKFYDFLTKANARHNIIVIDACRDYQKHYTAMEEKENREVLKNFRGNFRTVNIRYDDGIQQDELVVLDKEYSYRLPKSTIVSYATMFHQKAKDWSIHNEHHSPYSYALMHYLDDEEIPIEEVFRRVRSSLLKETNREQSNLEETNLEKNIWLVPKRAEIAVAPAL